MTEMPNRPSVPQLPRQILQVTPVYGVSIGDTITIPRADYRNWWQRRAPKWLGGQDAPRPFEGTITTIASGSATIIEDREP